MPFQSKAQRRWMYANHPEMAAEWSKHTPKGAKLPEKVKKAEIINALKFKFAKDQLEGGLADKMKDSAFPKKELAKGTKHELEHVKNRGMAKEIAKDHLAERKDYYTALDKADL
jgi:hypothetical protein